MHTSDARRAARPHQRPSVPSRRWCFFDFPYCESRWRNCAISSKGRPSQEGDTVHQTRGAGGAAGLGRPSTWHSRGARRAKELQSSTEQQQGIKQREQEEAKKEKQQPTAATTEWTPNGIAGDPNMELLNLWFQSSGKLKKDKSRVVPRVLNVKKIRYRDLWAYEVRC